MKIKHLVLLSVLIGIFLIGCTKNVEVHQPRVPVEVVQETLLKKSFPFDFIPRSLNVVAVGDSLTKGVGDSTNSGGYLPYLEESLLETDAYKEVEWTNYGVRGHRSDQLLNELQEQAVVSDMTNADLIIVTIGGNDVMQIVKENFNGLSIDDFRSALPKYEQNLSSILTTIRSHNQNATVFLLGVYNPFTRWFSSIGEFAEITRLWNETGRESVDELDNMYFVDIAPIFREEINVLYEEDFFHPNDLGYKKIAETVFKNIMDSTEGQLIETPPMYNGNED